MWECRFAGQVKVVHFAGPQKPWQLHWNARTGELSGTGSEGAEGGRLPLALVGAPVLARSAAAARGARGGRRSARCGSERPRRPRRLSDAERRAAGAVDRRGSPWTTDAATRTAAECRCPSRGTACAPCSRCSPPRSRYRSCRPLRPRSSSCRRESRGLGTRAGWLSGRRLVRSDPADHRREPARSRSRCAALSDPATTDSALPVRLNSCLLLCSSKTRSVDLLLFWSVDL